MRRSHRRIAVSALAVSSIFAATVPASATYAGSGGDIVFAGGGVRRISQDGSGERRFPSFGGGVEAVSFSSDGTEAAVADFTDHGVRILLLDLVHDTQSVLLSVHDAPTDEVFSVALSPDDSSLVFCDGFPGNLWTIGRDGSNLTEVAEGYCYADWGSTGRIVASKGIFHADGPRLITTMDPDGDNKTVIASFPPTKQAWDIVYVLRPSWAPDSSAVVFGAQRHTDRPDIWWVDADGSNLHKLTTTFSRSESGPVFSPDGSKVVFSRLNRQASTSDLYLVDMDGTDANRLTDTPDRDEYPLAWEPG